MFKRFHCFQLNLYKDAATWQWVFFYVDDTVGGGGAAQRTKVIPRHKIMFFAFNG